MAFKKLSRVAENVIERLQKEKMDTHFSYHSNHVKTEYDYFMRTFLSDYPTLFHAIPVYQESAKLMMLAEIETPEEEMVIQWNFLMATIIDQVIQQDDGKEE